MTLILQMRKQSFIFSAIRVLSTEVKGSVLGFEDAVMSKTDVVPALITISDGREGFTRVNAKC